MQKKNLRKKWLSLALVLSTSLLISSLMTATTLSITPYGKAQDLSRNPKSKIYGTPPAVLMSELGEDAPILITIYGSMAGLEEARAYVEMGEPRQLSSGEYMVRGVTTPACLDEIEAIPEITAVWTKMKPEVPDPSDLFPDPDNPIPETDMFQVRELLGVERLYSELGLTGEGVRIAIVDTGVDYAHPDLFAKLDYVTLPDGGREPLVLDADESQVLVLADFAAVDGYIPTVGHKPVLYYPYKLTLPALTVNYAVGTIPSASGIYKFGMTSESGPPSTFYRVGVLLTDPTTPGDYDTAYVDLNNDKDFTNDVAISYWGDRVTRIDMTGDGFPDRTIGTLGGFFYDVLLWFGPFAKYMPGWDRSGRYLSIFYDYGGHGTSCAGVAASSGVTTFTIPPFGSTKIQGIAPAAKVVGIKGLWFGNVEQGMLWAAGFDIDANGKFYYTGSKRADLVSNSWGISSQVYDIFGFGYDFESMFENGLAMPGFLDPKFSGMTIVHAAGNGGFGYGTITSPGAASLIITVGASTTFHSTAFLFSFSKEGKMDDIISWSARAPTPVGEIKPDVLNSGAFAFDVCRVWEAPYRIQGLTIFSGTSQATPLTAGVVALMFEATGKALKNPLLVRNILQTTAKDVGYNGLIQACGRVNAYDAVMLARKLCGINTDGFVYNIYSYDSMRNLQEILRQAWYLQWDAGIPDYFMMLAGNTLSVRWPGPQLWNVPSGSLFLGRMKPGTANQFKLYVQNPNAEEVEIVSSKALKYVKIGQEMFSDTLNIPLEGDGRLNYLFDPSAFEGSTLTMFNMYVDFSKMDTNYDYTWDYRYRLWIFEWIDEDGDGMIDEWELRLYNYSYQTGTTLEAPVGFLTDRLSTPNSKIVVRVEGTKRTTTLPALSTPFTVVITKYARAEDTTVNLKPLAKKIPAGKTVRIDCVLNTPLTATSGVHEGLIEVQLQSSEGLTTRILPYTYVAVVSLGFGSKVITPSPSNEEVLYDLGVVRGSQDWRWRYEAGDWRVYTVEVKDLRTFALEVSFQWTDPETTIDVFTLGPDGQFAGLYTGTGLGFSYVVPGSASGNYRFMWHSVFDRTGTPTLQNIAFPQTSYIVEQYAHRLKIFGYCLQTPAVFTIYIHEVLHDGNRLSEPIIGTVRPLTTDTRLPLIVPIAPGKSRSLETSVKLPYEVAISPTSPSPSNIASVIFDGATTGPIIFSPTLPVFLDVTYPANTKIFTKIINLKATVPSGATPGCYLAATLIGVTLPDLRVFVRTTTGTYTESTAPFYVFQDWTIISTFTGCGGFDMLSLLM